MNSLVPPFCLRTRFSTGADGFNLSKEGVTLMKKSLITAMAVSLIVGAATLPALAKDGNFTDDGELILDVQQEPYQDLSTPPPLDGDETEPVLDEPTGVSSQPAKTDEAEVGVQQEPVLDSKPQSSYISPRVANVSPTATPMAPVVKGEMIVDNASFKVDVSPNVVVEATRNITKLSIGGSTGLIPNSFSVSGKKLTFLKDKLNNSTSGLYVFQVTFDDGETDTFTLRVDGPNHPDDYWSSNIKVFNMNPASNRYVDFEMVSAATSLNVHYIEANGKTIPPSKYRIQGGTIIIDKSFLVSLGVQEFVRINMMYNKGQFMDLIVTVMNENVSGGLISPEDC